MSQQASRSSFLQIITKRIIEPGRFIQVLFGPRQVGKTTLVYQLLEKCKIPSHFASADAVAASNVVWLEQQWETARLKMDQVKAEEFSLVIDEIQKIGDWSETVKLLWDTDTRAKRALKVMLLGSFRLLLQQGLTESLAGRLETTYMGKHMSSKPLLKRVYRKTYSC
jgi:predicted AAA+ superfamily ATPase